MLMVLIGSQVKIPLGCREAKSHSVGLGSEHHTQRGGVGRRVGLACLCTHGVAGLAKSYSVGLGSERHTERGGVGWRVGLAWPVCVRMAWPGERSPILWDFIIIIYSFWLFYIVVRT